MTRGFRQGRVYNSDRLTFSYLGGLCTLACNERRFVIGPAGGLPVMSPSPSVQPLSRGPARQINEEARANPNSHYKKLYEMQVLGLVEAQAAVA